MRRIVFMGIFLYITLAAAHKARANEVDIAIAKAAHKYNLDVRLMRAIANVETNMGTTKLIRQNKNGTIDVGVFQINTVSFKLCKDLNILLMQGNADCAARILAHHKRTYRGQFPYWVAYHSKTPSRAAQYEARVRKVLRGQSDGYILYLHK